MMTDWNGLRRQAPANDNYKSLFIRFGKDERVTGPDGILVIERVTNAKELTGNEERRFL